MPFVFLDDGVYRSYHGDAEVNTIAPLRKKFNYSMYPTGTKDVFASEKVSGRMTTTDAFAAIFMSAFKIDYDWHISNRYNQ